MKLQKDAISTIAAISNIIVFIILILIAISFFPIGLPKFSPYNPLYNWLSDLGNYVYNPQGAIFFNIMLIINGILSILFFSGITTLSSLVGGRTVSLQTAQYIGYFSSVALIFVGLFTENSGNYHYIFSVMFFVSMFIVMVILSLIIVDRPIFLVIIPIITLGAFVINLILVFTHGPLYEWLLTISYLIFMLSLVVIMNEASLVPIISIK
jgi:hypothetical membrane protein